MDESKNTAFPPKPVTESQQFLLQTVWSHLVRADSWPSLREVDRDLDRLASLDIFTVAASLPYGLINTGTLRSLQASDPVALTLAGISACRGTSEHLQAFLECIGLATQLEREGTEDNSPAILDASAITESEKVRLPAAGRVHFLRQMYSVLTSDFWGYSHHGPGTVVTPWRITIDREVRRLRGVSTMPAYWNALRPPTMTTETDSTQGAKLPPNPRKVFVIHGRNEVARKDLFSFLRALSLEPIEWSQAIALTKRGAPYIGQVLDAAFDAAQAIIVLETPDDIVALHPSLGSNDDDDLKPQMQARANVLFEAGMAMGRNEDRTILVQLGKTKVFSDVHGRHVVRLDGSAPRRHELAQRLENAGCMVDRSGSDWLSIGEFSNPSLEASDVIHLTSLDTSRADADADADDADEFVFRNLSEMDGALMGEAVNTTDRTQSAIINVVLYNETGAIAATQQAVVNDVRPGRSKTFTFTRLPRYAKYRVELDTVT